MKQIISKHRKDLYFNENNIKNNSNDEVMRIKRNLNLENNFKNSFYEKSLTDKNFDTSEYEDFLRKENRKTGTTTEEELLHSSDKIKVTKQDKIMSKNDDLNNLEYEEPIKPASSLTNTTLNQKIERANEKQYNNWASDPGMNRYINLTDTYENNKSEVKGKADINLQKMQRKEEMSDNLNNVYAEHLQEEANLKDKINKQQFSADIFKNETVSKDRSLESVNQDSGEKNFYLNEGDPFYDNQFSLLSTSERNNYTAETELFKKSQDNNVVLTQDQQNENLIDNQQIQQIQNNNNQELSNLESTKNLYQRKEGLDAQNLYQNNLEINNNKIENSSLDEDTPKLNNNKASKIFQSNTNLNSKVDDLIYVMSENNKLIDEIRDEILNVEENISIIQDKKIQDNNYLIGQLNKISQEKMQTITEAEKFKNSFLQNSYVNQGFAPANFNSNDNYKINDLKHKLESLQNQLSEKERINLQEKQQKRLQNEISLVGQKINQNVQEQTKKQQQELEIVGNKINTKVTEMTKEFSDLKKNQDDNNFRMDKVAEIIVSLDQKVNDLFEEE